MIHYSTCPVCGSSDISFFLAAKDHTVSHKTFNIFRCGFCTAGFTQDVPGQEDIGPYYQSENYISHSNTNKGLVNNLYHKVRNRTLQQKRKLICTSTGLKQGNILDIGAGTGAFLQQMKIAGWTVTGLEPDEGSRNLSQELYGNLLQPAEELFRLPAKQFDAITMWHVLEHVHGLHTYVERLKELLKDDGRIFIAVPNYTSYDAEHYAAFWAAYDVPRHLYHFSPQSMDVLLSSQGLKVLDHKPMWYDSFYVSMLSEGYKNEKANIPSAVLTGLRSNIKSVKNVKNCSSVIYVIGKNKEM